jgi:23S rRNA (guanosine2251-2'-O)-methyltransferase
MLLKRRSLSKRQNPSAVGERYLYGVNVVTEWLRARPTEIIRVHYESPAANRVAALLRTASVAGVALQASEEPRLAALAGTSRHQGVVAVAKPFPYVELAQVVSRKPQLLIVADQIQDPHNLGALIRTAEAVGAGAVILPKDGTVSVSATVEVAAAGATALEPVCRVTNVARTLEALKQAGYWSMALVPSGGLDLYQADLPQPVAVVVGGEAGMRRLVARECDIAVSVPMRGKVESLNASVAAGVALYELVRRWGAGASRAD